MASEGEGKVYWRVNFVRFDRPQEAGGDRGFGRLPPQSDPSGNVNIVPDSCSTPLLVAGQPGLITEVETFEAGDNFGACIKSLDQNPKLQMKSSRTLLERFQC